MPRKKQAAEPEIVQLEFVPEPVPDPDPEPEVDPTLYYSSKEIRKLDALYNVVIGTRSNGKTYDWCRDVITVGIYPPARHHARGCKYRDAL